MGRTGGILSRRSGGRLLASSGDALIEDGLTLNAAGAVVLGSASSLPPNIIPRWVKKKAGEPAARRSEGDLGTG
jgi:hypothetical protein